MRYEGDSYVEEIGLPHLADATISDSSRASRAGIPEHRLNLRWDSRLAARRNRRRSRTATARVCASPSNHPLGWIK